MRAPPTAHATHTLACLHRCFFRPQAPFSEWITSAADGKVEAVQPTDKELAALAKVGSVVSMHSVISAYCVQAPLHLPHNKPQRSRLPLAPTSGSGYTGWRERN